MKVYFLTPLSAFYEYSPFLNATIMMIDSIPRIGREIV